MKKNNSRPSGRNNSQRPQQGGRPQHGRPQGAGRPQGGRPQAHAPRENQIPRDWRVVIGTHAINEVLKVRPKQVKGFWLRQGFENSGDLRDMNELALKNHIKVELKAEAALEKFGPSQQGAAIFVDGAPEFDMASLEGLDKSMVLILDGIEDPHNLGAILRTSWLVGAQGVLIPEDRAVGLTPTVHKVACGGVEHVPVEETTNFANYAEELKKQGYWIYGLSPRGKRSIFELELPDKVVWAVGSEDKGMRVTTERLCDELVFIPQASSSASYNASVATAMALTETLRQHAPRGNRKKS
ncbi:23S rRNA (guanosine-2'-O-)-methyltransferase RlmB [Bdellovibrio bacteriovorus]|uniref:TrmH family RNA methyltransferase n=1 Tax=Bdellovibrio bacteriovorus TaxID=959 RepID=UPI00045C0D3D|nr:RNA methyltransferase [Bdellovibrio bacteriovorus]AHZ83391.1 RNA methyltransferase [Bdellovibrio bacteriovorus]BEV69360.1 23S rRNA (guanosine-2'-O-)-methyltransferase RlmB [Bdellovibrio bacteriovorus]